MAAPGRGERDHRAGDHPAEPDDSAARVDEALLIALSGVRLTLTNLIILRALRDGERFDPDWYADAVRDELRDAAAQAEHDADRIADERMRAIRRSGRPRTPSDYRALDAARLDRREEVLRGLSEQLRALGADPDRMEELIRAARDRALEEIASAMQPQGPVPAARRPAMGAAQRREALGALADDLANLRRRAEDRRRRSR